MLQPDAQVLVRKGPLMLALLPLPALRPAFSLLSFLRPAFSLLSFLRPVSWQQLSS